MIARLYAVAVAVVAAALCASGVHGLVYQYRTAGGELGPALLVYHLNAQNFGADSYDTGLVPLVKMLPQWGCNTTDGWDANGKLVLIARGYCTFALKGYSAQLAGAVGAIIGSGTDGADGTRIPPDQIVPMSASESDPNAAAISIPVVSIAQQDFDDLVTNVDNASRSGDAALAQLNADGSISYDEWKLNGSLRFLTILILVLPGIWLMCFLFYWGRRQCALRVNRQQRQRVASSIPLTAFHREPHMDAPATVAGDETKAGDSDGAAAQPAAVGGTVGGSSGAASNSGSSTTASAGGARGRRKIHNSACAVCLDDFKENEMVKVLPCQHAFHAACIDPWLDERSDACPICKQSIVIGSSNLTSHCSCCWRSREVAVLAGGSPRGRDAAPPVVRANSDFQPLELSEVPATPGRSGAGAADGAAAPGAGAATPREAPAATADVKQGDELNLSIADDAV